MKMNAISVSNKLFRIDNDALNIDSLARKIIASKMCFNLISVNRFDSSYNHEVSNLYKILCYKFNLVSGH